MDPQMARDLTGIRVYRTALGVMHYLTLWPVTATDWTGCAIRAPGILGPSSAH